MALIKLYNIIMHFNNITSLTVSVSEKERGFEATKQ